MNLNHRLNNSTTGPKQKNNLEKKKQLPSAADPKVVVDGAYGVTPPASIPVLGRLQVPNLAAKLASLRSALNSSQPRLVPNVSGIVAAKRAYNATQTDLGFKQNIRRAEGQTLNAAAGAVENAKALGDSILFWNKVSVRVFANAATTGEQPGPVLGSRALSIVHLSMYDAYAGALGNPADLPKYLPQLEPSSLAARASPKAAVAGAAYESLLHLYPKQKAVLDAELLRFCDGARGPLGLVGLQPSLVYGEELLLLLILESRKDPKKKKKNLTRPLRQEEEKKNRGLRRQLRPPPEEQRPRRRHLRALRLVHSLRCQPRVPVSGEALLKREVSSFRSLSLSLSPAKARSLASPPAHTKGIKVQQ